MRFFYRITTYGYSLEVESRAFEARTKVWNQSQNQSQISSSSMCVYVLSNFAHSGKPHALKIVSGKPHALKIVALSASRINNTTNDRLYGYSPEVESRALRTFRAPEIST